MKELSFGEMEKRRRRGMIIERKPRLRQTPQGWQDYGILRVCQDFIAA